MTPEELKIVVKGIHDLQKQHWQQVSKELRQVNHVELSRICALAGRTKEAAHNDIVDELVV